MNKYNAIHYYSEDDNCYIAEIPALAGCIADGSTIDEALNNIKIVEEEWLEVNRAMGRPVPKCNSDFVSTSPEIEDVAKYILDITGKSTAMMLEKLTYYCLVWSLVWYNKPIFKEKFQAWVNGPVNDKLFKKHKGMKIVSSENFSDIQTHSFSASEKELINSVINVYGKMTPEEISKITHIEDPWKKARNGLPANVSSRNVINNDDILSYYKNV